MAFQEYTAYWLGDSYNNKYDSEIYLHFDEKGKLIRAYCYKDQIPIKFKDLHYPPYQKEIIPKTTDSINPLFVNLSKEFIIGNLINIYLPEADDNPEIDDYLLAALKNYPKLLDYGY